MHRLSALTGLIAATLLLPITASAQSTDDFAAIGRQIALSFDATNGHPAQALTGAECRGGLCGEAGGMDEHDQVASAIATGLAGSLDIPVEAPGVEPTVCPWGAEDAEGRHGLTTRFGVIDAAPDAATVLVTSSCVSSRGLRPLGFVQGHVYHLEKALDGSWAVTSTELRFIS